MYYCPATPRYFPLIICHVSMQISIHWLRTGYRILSPIKDIENCNCQLEFVARSRLSNPLGRLPIVQSCTLFHANAIGFFFPPYPYIFSIFSIEFLWQFTMDSVGIWHCSRNPGANSFWWHKQLPKSCCTGRPAAGWGVRGEFSARKFACSSCNWNRDATCNLLDMWKMKNAIYFDIATGLISYWGCFRSATPPYRPFATFAKFCMQI